MILIAKLRRTQPGLEPEWLVDIPILNAMTQGADKGEAMDMARDLILDLFDAYFSDVLGEPISVAVLEERGANRLRIVCQPARYLYALVLRRQREAIQATIREVSARLGSDSPNAYARYESGEVVPSAETFNRLLLAIDPLTTHGLVLR